jgi:hypothetical protein
MDTEWLLSTLLNDSVTRPRISVPAGCGAFSRFSARVS